MIDPPPYPPTNYPELHLLYASARLPNPTEVTLKDCFANSQETLHLTWAQQDAHSCLGKAALGEHDIHVAGLGIPLPRELIDRTVMISPWQAQIKAAMRQHQSHISLVYNQGNPDPIEQMLALYSLACVFVNEDLLGIVNANAWTAHPPADFLNPPVISGFRDQIPFNLWVGYVRFFTDADSYWLVTKGHHIFDVPDLAYQVHPDEDPNEIIRLFINVFYYLYEQDVFVSAGDTLELSSSGQQLVFSEVYELEEVLMGPAGTLVLRQTNPPA